MPVIRPFRVRDIEQVVRISNTSLKENYDVELFFNISESWNGTFLVAISDNIVSGFINGLMESEGVSRILMLAVHSDYRGQGIGSALLNNFTTIIYSRGARKILLEVRPSNLTAVEFYRKRGFKTMGIIKNFYQNGENGIKMVKSLPERKVK